MSTLNTLKLVAVKRPTNVPAIVQRRNKVLAKLWEQLKLAEAEQAGTNYAPTKYKKLKDADGNIKTIEMPKRIKPWWFTSDGGNTCLSLRYGSKVIEIAKGKTAIELFSKQDLVATLTTLKTAIEAGELDSQIDAASESVRKGFHK